MIGLLCSLRRHVNPEALAIQPADWTETEDGKHPWRLHAVPGLTRLVRHTSGSCMAFRVASAALESLSMLPVKLWMEEETLARLNFDAFSKSMARVSSELQFRSPALLAVLSMHVRGIARPEVHHRFLKSARQIAPSVLVMFLCQDIPAAVDPSDWSPHSVSQLARLIEVRISVSAKHPCVPRMMFPQTPIPMPEHCHVRSS